MLQTLGDLDAFVHAWLARSPGTFALAKPQFHATLIPDLPRYWRDWYGHDLGGPGVAPLAEDCAVHPKVIELYSRLGRLTSPRSTRAERDCAPLACCDGFSPPHFVRLASRTPNIDQPGLVEIVAEVQECWSAGIMRDDAADDPVVYSTSMREPGSGPHEPISERLTAFILTTALGQLLWFGCGMAERQGIERHEAWRLIPASDRIVVWQGHWIADHGTHVVHTERSRPRDSFWAAGGDVLGVTFGDRRGGWAAHAGASRAEIR